MIYQYMIYRIPESVCITDQEQGRYRDSGAERFPAMFPHVAELSTRGPGRGSNVLFQ
jgi:hypothetical protein